MLHLVFMPVLVTAQPEVAGVFGLESVGSNGYLAVWIPLEEDQSLDGLIWYNNDSTAPFAALSVSAGADMDPGSASCAYPQLESVTGGSSQWSQALFPEPVGSTTDGLYVLFRLPLGSSYESRGTGGGAAIGYVEMVGGPGAWLSADGGQWLPLAPTFSPAIEPILSEAGATTQRLEPCAQKSSGADEQEIPLVTAMQAPHPNPFNPKTTLEFTLKRACEVDLAIFDLQGRRVRTLAAGRFSAGLHVLDWLGRDDSGRRQASGVYLTCFRADGVETNHKLALVR
jgi:hypothetical protein